MKINITVELPDELITPYMEEELKGDIHQAVINSVWANSSEASTVKIERQTTVDITIQRE